MLETYIKQKLSSDACLIMTHCVVGYPSLEDNWRMLENMQDAGISLVELQLPFSEPIADGPLFVKANQQALENGTYQNEYFNFMSKASKKFDFPLLFMGYYNSVYSMGEEKFCKRLKQAGGQAYIVADLPPNEAAGLDQFAQQNDLDAIHLMTPNNTEVRLKEIAVNASGFIYCVARKGVTGTRTELDESTIDYIQHCRRATKLPIALGFGIKTTDDIAMIKDHIDIAIIGTACLEAWETQGENGYKEFLHALSEAAN